MLAVTEFAPPCAPRDRLMQSALHLFAERGFHAVSLRQLGAEVGLQAGSLYAHIQSKQSLLQELIEEGLDDLIESARQALHGVGDPQRRLRLFLHNDLRFRRRHPQWSTLATSELRQLDGEQREEIQAQRQAYADQLAAVLRRMRPEATASAVGRLAVESITLLDGLSALHLDAEAEWLEDLFSLIVSRLRKL